MGGPNGPPILFLRSALVFHSRQGVRLLHHAAPSLPLQGIEGRRVMRNLLLVFSTSLCSLLLDAPSWALEKHALAVQNKAEEWSNGATCRVSYYNVCTGWVWCWSGFGDDFRFGVVVDQCCEGGAASILLQSSLFLCIGAPPVYPGFGYTGTIAVHSVDANDCPTGAPIAIQPYLPAYVTFPFSVVNWGGITVPNRFALVVTTEENGLPSSAEFGSDHPAAGPTGPPSCGACYPANRVSRSYQWGTVSSPLCPGEKFNDGVCDAELISNLDFSCAVSVEETSWGSVKGLYR